MPRLRERKEDLDALIEYLLARLSLEMSLENPGITTEALHKIKEYDWPGNIRELSNCLKKALIFNRGASLQADEITLHQEQKSPEAGAKHAAAPEILPWIKALLQSEKKERLFDYCLDYVAELLIREALEITQGNRSNAAKLLGISRPTLHAKIEKFKKGLQ